MVDQQTDPVCLYERSGTIRYANFAYAELFDLTPAEMEGVYLSDLAPESGWDEAESNLLRNAALRLGESAVHEFELVGVDDTPIWFEWRDEPVQVPNSDEQLILGIGRNTTDRHLDAQSMFDLNRQLEASNRDLADFAAIASHDLREPLRKISSFGSRLEQSAAAELSPRNIDYVRRMVSASDRMQRLIDGLLTLSRVTTQGRDFEKVELGDVVATAISDLELAIADADATVRCGSLPSIQGDSAQLGELFQNLIANAVKFRREGVAPVVSIDETHIGRGQSGRGQSGSGQSSRGDSGATNTVSVSVVDNGIGFDPTKATMIFGTFARLHGRSEYEGSGIGLSVCKRIAERHGGTISAMSAPGEGTTFVVTLPRS